MIDINSLPHVSELDDIETNFKVCAGPGAGKTTWLIGHLHKILEISCRLHFTRKIACITYTNVAAEEISAKLSCDKYRFDITTIHSFLYRNIIKPFSYLISHDTYGEMLFNINKLDGHTEHIPHNDIVRKWCNVISELNNKNYYYLQKKMPDVVEQLYSIDYKFTCNNYVDLFFKKKHDVQIPTKNGELWCYKKEYWKNGIMHHEDILYFSYLIIKKFPRVLEFVRNKYPYILIDEFQDTTELQTWIIRNIAEYETKVGVIGDLAQSIYKFAGANRKDFETFELEGMSSFKLEKNHRSTKSIIDFLNCLRSDICQEENVYTSDGHSVKVLIGETQDAIKWLNDNSFTNHYILTRRNDKAEEIKQQTFVQNENLLFKLYSMDSNIDRVNLIHSILKGYKLYINGYYKNAVEEIIRILKYKIYNSRKSIHKLDLRRTAIQIIDNLKIDIYQHKSLYNFYYDLLEDIYQKYNINIAPKVTSKLRAKPFYEQNTLSDLLKHIKVDTKSTDTIRTIHSAKGTQFDHVLIPFDHLSDFEMYVLDAKNYIDAENEETRIYYVGFSRAVQRLFINIPELNNRTIQKLNEMNVDYEFLNI